MHCRYSGTPGCRPSTYCSSFEVFVSKPWICHTALFLTPATYIFEMVTRGFRFRDVPSSNSGKEGLMKVQIAKSESSFAKVLWLGSLVSDPSIGLLEGKSGESSSGVESASQGTSPSSRHPSKLECALRYGHFVRKTANIPYRQRYTLEQLRSWRRGRRMRLS